MAKTSKTKAATRKTVRNLSPKPAKTRAVTGGRKPIRWVPTVT